MERTITVVLTNSNDKKVFTSNANTLGELKTEMSNQGIDYHNMDFMEGLSHTQMIDDAAILPSNVQYKGKVTNNLVFMLSTTNKHIASGAYDRKECYAKIKELNLQDEVKIQTGKNFTQVSTDTLNNIIASHNKPKTVIPTTRKDIYEYIKTNNLSEKIKEVTGKNYTVVSTDKLIEICKNSNVDDIPSKKKSTKKEVKKEVKSPYSTKELDEIINSLRK